MGTKVFKLTELRDVQGRPFRGPERDGNDDVIREPVKDSEGHNLMQVPRDAKGQPIPNSQPEPVYRLKTKPLGKDALPELLKGLYLNIPQQKLTRQDTIYGTRMFQSIAAMKDGVLELDEDVHSWLVDKFKGESSEENIGLQVFGVDMYIILQALDNFERLHEKKEAGK